MTKGARGASEVVLLYNILWTKVCLPSSFLWFTERVVVLHTLCIYYTIVEDVRRVDAHVVLVLRITVL